MKTLIFYIFIVISLVVVCGKNSEKLWHSCLIFSTLLLSPKIYLHIILTLSIWRPRQSLSVTCCVFFRSLVKAYRELASLLLASCELVCCSCFFLPCSLQARFCPLSREAPLLWRAREVRWYQGWYLLAWLVSTSKKIWEQSLEQSQARRERNKKKLSKGLFE